MSKPSDLIHGTLDLLILNTVSLQPEHGWAIAKRIQQVSNEVLQINQGALYPALHRLEQQGWIRSNWRITESGRDAKFYALTRAGRTQLQKELGQWERLSNAVALVIHMAPETPV
jgi:PadR family transcriptional regulator PadR